MRFLVVVAAGLVFAAVAPAGTSLDPKKLVLAQSAFPSGLKLVYAGAHSPPSADVKAPSNSRAWIVAYSNMAPPIRVYSSNAFVFTSNTAAHSYLTDATSTFTATHMRSAGFGAASLPRLGDEQHAWTFAGGGGGPPQAMVLVRSGSVVWGLDIAQAAARATLLSELRKLALEQQALMR
jgi:hypothetical protein